MKYVISDTNSSHCPFGQYQCESTNQCISGSWRCDAEKDCLLGDDEEHCGKSGFTPGAGFCIVLK